MGLIAKRARHKEEFRREILDSARELFINDGYEQFSMRKLAEKIGYSPTTIYLYFNSKDDLLFAISEEFFERFFNQFNHILSITQDPIETLRQACLYLIEFGLRNPNQYRLIFFTKHNVYGTREEFIEKDSMAKNTYVVFKEMVHECIKTGRFRESDENVISPALAIIAHGLVVMNLYRPNYREENIDIIARTLVDAVLRGYQK
jgi:AcrR family transcriptional regulator